MATRITRDIIESYLNCKYKGHLKLTGESGTPSDYEAMTTAARQASREEAVAENWFGPVSKRFADRIGDVVVAARGGTAIVRSNAEPGLSVLPGQHGALSAEEQWVPLLVARGS